MNNNNEEWLIASNASKYNIKDAFDSYETITWGLKSKLQVGCIVYIYVSAPESCIRYKCVVSKINVPESERLGAEYWIEPFDPNRNLINLNLLTVFHDERLQLQSLIDGGYIKSAPQGPRRVTNNLATLLDNI
jgi:5-methylcytosine-specific restriction protein A